jgi:hypothetical protein
MFEIGARHRTRRRASSHTRALGEFARMLIFASPTRISGFRQEDCKWNANSETRPQADPAGSPSRHAMSILVHFWVRQTVLRIYGYSCRPRRQGYVGQFDIGCRCA